MNQELIDYIKKAREAGQSDEQIKQALLAAGWKENDILDVMDIVVDIVDTNRVVFSNKGKSRFGILIKIFIVLIIIVVGVAGYLYWGKYNIPIEKKLDLKNIDGDFLKINIAFQEAKKWQDDACLELVNFFAFDDRRKNQEQYSLFQFSSEGASSINMIKVDVNNNVTSIQKINHLYSGFTCINKDDFEISSQKVFEIAGNISKSFSIYSFGGVSCSLQNDPEIKVLSWFCDFEDKSHQKNVLITINAISGDIISKMIR